MKLRAFTVTETNNYIKRIFDYEPILSNMAVTGEMSNFKLHTSGHAYFSLKDEQARLNCVMFRHEVDKLDFMPEDGMKIQVRGKVGIFEKEGKVQMYANQMERLGLGDLHLKFEELKRRLERLGYFDSKHKKPLPKSIDRIAVVTSPTGAVIRDILHVSGRRSQLADLLVMPVKVQGIGAAEAIVKAIEQANALNVADVIILARGGGSMEDLWAFNEEQVAHAIYDSRIPIVSAIGHETDFTIADFVSDLRAPTPSAAAELVTREDVQLKRDVETCKHRMDQRISRWLDAYKQELHYLSPSRQYNGIMATVSKYQVELQHMMESMKTSVSSDLQQKQKSLEMTGEVLGRMNPLAVLGRGYGFVMNEHNQVVDSIDHLVVGEQLNVVLKDGRAGCTVHHIDRK